MVPYFLLNATENKILGKTKRTKGKQDIILLHEIARLCLDIISQGLHPVICMYYLKLFWSFFLLLARTVHFRWIVTAVSTHSGVHDQSSSVFSL